MSELIIINSGDEIKSTNYWNVAASEANGFFVSVSDGCVRILVPANKRHQLRELVAGTKKVTFRILRTADTMSTGVVAEFVFEGCKDPVAIGIPAGGFDRLPSPSHPWKVAIWGQKNFEPHKFLQRELSIELVDQLEHFTTDDQRLEAGSSAETLTGAMGGAAYHAGDTVANAGEAADRCFDELSSEDNQLLAKKVMPLLLKNAATRDGITRVHLNFFDSEQSFELSPFRELFSYASYSDMLSAMLKQAKELGIEILFFEVRWSQFQIWSRSRNNPCVDLTEFFCEGMGIRRRLIRPSHKMEDFDYEWLIAPPSDAAHQLDLLNLREMQESIDLVDELEREIYHTPPIGCRVRQHLKLDYEVERGAVIMKLFRGGEKILEMRTFEDMREPLRRKLAERIQEAVRLQ